jgi:hypothetical protein
MIDDTHGRAEWARPFEDTVNLKILLVYSQLGKEEVSKEEAATHSVNISSDSESGDEDTSMAEDSQEEDEKADVEETPSLSEQSDESESGDDSDGDDNQAKMKKPKVTGDGADSHDGLFGTLEPQRQADELAGALMCVARRLRNEDGDLAKELLEAAAEMTTIGAALVRTLEKKAKPDNGDVELLDVITSGLGDFEGSYALWVGIKIARMIVRALDYFAATDEATHALQLVGYRVIGICKTVHFAEHAAEPDRLCAINDTMSSLDKGLTISRDLLTIAGHAESQLKTLNTYLCAFHMDEGYCDPESLGLHMNDKREDIRELQHHHALLEDENSRHKARIADLSARLSDAKAQAQVNVSSGDTAAQDTTSHEIVSAAEGQSSAQLLRSALPATISSGDFVQLVAMLSAEAVMSMGLNPWTPPLQNVATATIDAPSTTLTLNKTATSDGNQPASLQSDSAAMLDTSNASPASKKTTSL